MLVITRRASESVYISGMDVCFTILEISGRRVKLGIEAPKHISINRAEKMPARIEAEAFLKAS